MLKVNISQDNLTNALLQWFGWHLAEHDMCVYLLTTSGNTKVLPQEVKMHERRPSLDYHGKRMHSEYNDDDDEEDYFLFVIDPLKNISAFELFLWRCRQRGHWMTMTTSLQVTGKYKNTGKKQTMSQLTISGSGELFTCPSLSSPFEPHQSLLNIEKSAN